MTKSGSIPQTDSIKETARFWDNHDLTDFADELEEVSEPVFERLPGTVVTIQLPQKELMAIRRIAQE